MQRRSLRRQPDGESTSYAWYTYQGIGICHYWGLDSPDAYVHGALVFFLYPCLHHCRRVCACSKADTSIRGFLTMP